MLKNMNRFDEEAEMLYANFTGLRDLPIPSDVGKAAKHALMLIREWSKTRECMLDAQKAAVDAAPFVHARLSAMAVNVSTDVVQKPGGEMTKEQRMDYFNKLRLRPTSHVPLQITIDNETGDHVEEDE